MCHERKFRKNAAKILNYTTRLTNFYFLLKMKSNINFVFLPLYSVTYVTRRISVSVPHVYYRWIKNAGAQERRAEEENQ